MNELTGQPQDKSTCPKRMWVMSALSDDDTVRADGTLPQWVEFHLSRCPSCRTLADDLQAVTTGLAGLASEAGDASLLERANRQARSALSRGAQMTGRVEVTTEPDILKVTPVVWWHPARMVPLAAAAAIGLALGVYGLRSQPDAGAITRTPEAATTTVPKKEKPKAALASDAVNTKHDPTAVPPAYRGDDCTGDDCVERAFIPGRGRRPASRPRLDTPPHKESTTPAPNDP